MRLWRILLRSKDSSLNSWYFVMDVFTSEEDARRGLEKHPSWMASDWKIVSFEACLHGECGA